MYKRFFTSTTFLITFITLLFSFFVSLYLKDGELFGQVKEKTLIDLLIFDLSRDGIYFYLSLVFSLFYHSNLNHLMINLSLLLVIGLLGENKIGKLKFLFILLAGHLLTLLTLKLQYYLMKLDAVYAYSGLSAGTSTLLIYFLLKQKKYWGTLLVITYFSFETYQNKGPLSDPHLIAIFFGLLFYGINLITRYKTVNINQN